MKRQCNYLFFFFLMMMDEWWMIMMYWKHVLYVCYIGDLETCEYFLTCNIVCEKARHKTTTHPPKTSLWNPRSFIDGSNGMETRWWIDWWWVLIVWVRGALPPCCFKQKDPITATHTPPKERFLHTHTHTHCLNSLMVALAWVIHCRNHSWDQIDKRGGWRGEEEEKWRDVMFVTSFGRGLFFVHLSSFSGSPSLS